MLGIHFSFQNFASRFFSGTQQHPGTRFTTSEPHILIFAQLAYGSAFRLMLVQRFSGVGFITSGSTNGAT